MEISCQLEDGCVCVHEDGNTFIYHSERPTADRPQLVLVFFIGGCTYAEISALRFLAQREDGMCLCACASIFHRSCDCHMINIDLHVCHGTTGTVYSYVIPYMYLVAIHP